MIIEKAKLSFATSDDKTRFTLCGIYVDGDKAVATDGRMMAIVPIRREENDKTGVIVPGEVIKAAERFAGKSGESVVELNESAKAANSKGCSVSLPYIEANYPNYKNVIPEDCPVTICLDAQRLLDLAKALGAQGRRGMMAVKLHIKDAESPIRVTTSENPGALGVLMPVRS